MIEQTIASFASKAVSELYGAEIGAETFRVERTNLQYRDSADYTLMVFPVVRFSKKSPEDTAVEMGKYLGEHAGFINSFSVVKGFLNLQISNKFWLEFLLTECKNLQYGFEAANNNSKPVVLEFSSPNTNKPLHLGHIRNNLLGESLSRILEAKGQKIVKVNLVNDRGIHICKSLLARKKWGSNESPESTGLKGDAFAGKFYVEFEKHYRFQVDELVDSGMDREEAVLKAPLMLEAREMLIKWEEGDKDVRNHWAQMNAWVYQGFDKTYEKLGIQFHKVYYESDTYLLGRKIVEEGLKKAILFKKEDGSVWIDLRDNGLDEKLLLRADGTSLYMTQDIGTAVLRHQEFNPQSMIYVVGNEQNYHFDVLKLVLQKLGYDWAGCIRHFSYGMVELPEGKMKSREGTVVDADELIEEMITTARIKSIELGKSAQFEVDDAEALYEMTGLAALKYFILKVDPAKNMMFNPEESIDFDGNTGPFIQYTHARICSLLKRSEINISKGFVLSDFLQLQPEEKELLIACYSFKRALSVAASELSPALIANYVYELAKLYNQFYQKIPVLKENDKDLLHFRLALSSFTASIIKNAMMLLGIAVPEKM